MALDAGWAGILGTAMGSLITICGNAAIERQKNRRIATLAQKRRQKLRRMLSGDKYTWRSLKVLAASIGADEATTADLLVEIDARASLTNNDSWALESRAPWPDDMQPEK